MNDSIIRPVRTTLGTLAVFATALVLMGSYTGSPVTNGGTVSGVARFDGTPPSLPANGVGPEFAAICGQSVPNEEVIVGPDGTLANVVVWIDGITSGVPAEPQELVLDQVQCRYTPHVLAAVRGSRLTITSSDDTLHNTHGVQERRTVFNLALPNAGIEIPRQLVRPGIVDIRCDAGHTWMSAFVHVFEHPYFAVTGADGGFTLPDVPPGTYTVRAWHERFGELSGQVTVASGGLAEWSPSFTDAS